MRRAAIIALLVAARALAADAPAPPAPVSAQAGGATVTVRTQAADVRVGQPVPVEFVIDRPAGVSVELPQLPASLDEWDVRGAQTLPPDPVNPDRLVQRVTFVTFEAGSRPLPSLTFTVRAADGKATPLASPALTLSVASLNQAGFDPAAIRDAKGAVEIPTAPQWPWIVGGALLALLAAIGAWLGRARLKALFFPPAPPESPHDRAMRELESLQALGLPAAGRVQDFYVRLTGTVRHLIEGHFGIRAPEQTTAEFLRSARHHPGLLDEHQRFLTGFLRSADLVKFAGDRPAVQECDRSLQAARQFVQETLPRDGDAGSTTARAGSTATEAAA